MGLLVTLGLVIGIILLCSIRQISEYQRGILFRFGKFARIMNPGWNIVLPIIESFQKIDIRTKAVIAVEHYQYAVSQLAQTTMRNAVGAVTLDDLLSERDKISTEICDIIDKATDPWGIKVENVELKDIKLPEEMQRVIAKVAEAEREKLAVITKSKGEVEAAENLAKAAEEMSKTPGALHLRTLSTLNDLSSDQSNTIIFAVPVEVLRAFEGADLSKIIKKD